MGKNPSRHSRTGVGRDATGLGKDAVKDIPEEALKGFPVEMVSWDDAQLFLAKLNQRDKHEGWMYRLPKEAEWEYACRGGPMSDPRDIAFDFYFGKGFSELQPDQANFEHGMGLKRTCEVASYQPNLLGLYDIHGNVWEWCDDAPGGDTRAIRGGGWDYGPAGCRAAGPRVPGPSSARTGHLGLRLARVPAGKEIVAPPPPRPEK